MKKSAQSTQLDQAQLKRLKDSLTLSPSERFQLMLEAAERHFRKHPEIARARRQAIAAGNLQWRPKNRWELELVRNKHGKKRFEVVEVPYR